MTFFNPRQWLRPIVLVACVMPFTTQAAVLSDWQGQPDDAVVATILKQNVTWSTLKLAASDASEADRLALNEDPEVFSSYVKKLAMRQYIIKQAENIKLDESSVVEFAVRQAYDKAMMVQWLDFATQPEEGFPSQQQINTAYEENKQQFVVPARVNLSQLFLLHSDDKQADATRLETVLNEIKADPNRFAELSKIHSDDVASAASGGSLGWLRVNQIQPNIIEAIGSLQAGQISNPITTDTGSHFILINNITPASVKPIEDVTDAIIQALQNQQQQEKQQQMVNQLLVLVNINSVD